MSHFDAYSPYPPPPARRPTNGGSSLVPALVVLTLLGWLAVAAMLWRGGWPFGGPSGGAESRAVTPRGDLAGDEKTTIDIYNKAKRSVVHITTLASRRDPWNLNVQQVPEGTGSGFVWDTKGDVVTNYHVVRSAVESKGGVKVLLDDQSEWTADNVRYYPEKDLAVVHINAPSSKLIPIDVGSSGDLQVGQKVFAIGNPFGLDQTLTTGVVSALGREINSEVADRPIQNVIQTDAAINPGNSGGPLLDSAGRLIGMNTAIISRSGSSAGIGFAIPVDEVNRVVAKLGAGDKSIH
jgi:S1-C subfamily serine protease